MKQLIIMGSIALLLGGTSVAFATPPDSIAISMDSTHFLSVEVHHPVKQWPSAHFISRITVELNGKTIITQDFTSQSSQEWQYASYQLNDAKQGDKITVVAECSLFGKAAVDYTVPALNAGGG